MIDIIKEHTIVNYTKGNSGRKYIVLHYTGNTTDTAKANANYFKNKNRGASAHYFVDDNSIYEIVSPDNTAWSVGKNYGKNNLFGVCTNENSISIEMCSTNGNISGYTMKNTAELTRKIMNEYNISLSNVVRHYDVCSKHCPGWPGWLPGNETQWNTFKQMLKKEEGTNEMQCTYNIDGGETIYWFDGVKIHQLNHIDQLNVIRQIYKDNNNKDMPHYKWSSKAPWHQRLIQAINNEGELKK